MPTRGRHQSTSKEGQRLIRWLEALDGVEAVIIGRSYGGKSLGQGGKTGSLKLQRAVLGGYKAVLQSEKGLQELFIKVHDGAAQRVHAAVRLRFEGTGTGK